MDKSTDAIDKLEGGSGDTDDISDDELFKQPPNEECPICNLLLPWLASGSVYIMLRKNALQWLLSCTRV